MKVETGAPLIHFLNKQTVGSRKVKGSPRGLEEGGRVGAASGEEKDCAEVK